MQRWWTGSKNNNSYKIKRAIPSKLIIGLRIFMHVVGNSQVQKIAQKYIKYPKYNVWYVQQL